MLVETLSRDTLTDSIGLIQKNWHQTLIEVGHVVKHDEREYLR
jgi:hypothetical protein